ncbi:MAG TPA: RNA polymerase sigma factor [Polyangia bacterium]
MGPFLRLVPTPAATASAGEPGDEAAGEIGDEAGSDGARLVAGLKAGEAWAARVLAAQYEEHVRRVLWRVLGGFDGDAADLAQETFERALRGIGQLNEARSLKAWLTQVAVFTAREEIRRRKRRRWMPFSSAPEPSTAWAGPELQAAAEAVYRIFDRMPEDERLPFALRAMMGLDLEETAGACAMSLATVRRRLERAERRFFKLAGEYEALRPWLSP